MTGMSATRAIVAACREQSGDGGSGGDVDDRGQAMRNGRPRVVVFGMPCSGSLLVLRALLAADIDVRGVVLAAVDEVESSAVAEVARAAAVPVVPLRSARTESATTAIRELAPEVLVAACFPWRLPPAILALPRLGALNVHPSLLPAGRGPAPVFWTLRRGERRTGATIHLMDAGFDTGPIVAQAAIDVPAGIRAPALETALMTLGGRLAVDAIASLPTAGGRHAVPLQGTPQDETRATYAPQPTKAAFAVPTNLPARWAYTFVRGAAPLGGPLELLVLATGQRVPLRDALDYDDTARQREPLLDDGDGVLRVRFQRGVARLLAR
jgi:methionyl-tRNA formyltransferase